MFLASCFNALTIVFSFTVRELLPWTFIIAIKLKTQNLKWSTIISFFRHQIGMGLTNKGDGTLDRNLISFIPSKLHRCTQCELNTVRVLSTPAGGRYYLFIFDIKSTILTITRQ